MSVIWPNDEMMQMIANNTSDQRITLDEVQNEAPDQPSAHHFKKTMP